jgi:hypothetical protein
MRIDDLIGAVHQRFEDEERSSDPVLPYVAKLVDKKPRYSALIYF